MKLKLFFSPSSFFFLYCNCKRTHSFKWKDLCLSLRINRYHHQKQTKKPQQKNKEEGEKSRNLPSNQPPMTISSKPKTQKKKKKMKKKKKRISSLSLSLSLDKIMKEAVTMALLMLRVWKFWVQLKRVCFTWRGQPKWSLCEFLSHLGNQLLLQPWQCPFQLA